MIGARRAELRTRGAFAVPLFLLLLALPSVATADYLKVDPPPDVDKSAHGHSGTNTCWQATAANMLAGAGYGSGPTVQHRADEIYEQMVAHFTTAPRGWPDTALTWWLNSANNVWPSNRYTVVTVHGLKTGGAWHNPDAPEFIGNQLRDCQTVGACIYGVGYGHAITPWGDEQGPDPLTGNPGQLWVTDSDSDAGGNVQRYTYMYDPYNVKWEIPYVPGRPGYIGSIVTLCPTDVPDPPPDTQKIIGSYKINQTRADVDATDLHYNVGTDVDILAYNTTIDWATQNSPVIQEDASPPRNLTVDWDLSDNPVPFGQWVTITTELVVPTWNIVTYSDVHFTYPDGSLTRPDFTSGMETPNLPEDLLLTENITGGYVIAAFDLYADPNGTELIGQYRFGHEYDYDQDPGLHHFFLDALQAETYYIGNLQFGHSYGFLDGGGLWEFRGWRTEFLDIVPFDVGNPIDIDLDWPDLRSYPTGVPEPGTVFLLAIGALPFLRRWRTR